MGLLQNPTALLCWMVTGPEVTKVIDNFESKCLTCHVPITIYTHHEHKLSTQTTFGHEIKDFVRVVDDMGNPFMEESKELLVLDTRDIAHSSVVNTIRCIEKIGQDQYNEYVNIRFVMRTKTIDESIKRNNLLLVNYQLMKVPSRTAQIHSSLKEDCQLFSRL